MFKNALFLGAVFTLSAPIFAADETRPLADLTVKDGWKPEQWNKAEGRVGIRPDFPEALADVPAAQKQSLGIKINWPGGEDFRFYNLAPVAASEPIPFKAKAVQVWVSGSGTAHTFQLNFEDGDGKDQKLAMGSVGFTGWKQLKTAIPSSWKQPIAFKSLTFHNWDTRAAADITVYATKLEVIVDNAEKVGGSAGEARPISDLNLPGEWKAGQYNSATGTVSIIDDFPAELQTDGGAPRRSLQADLKFPGFGDGFKFWSLEPSTPTAIPFKLLKLSLWMKSPNTPQFLEFQFKDAGGKSVKVSPSPGNLSFAGWRQVSARIPATFAQPLTFMGISVHNYGLNDPAAFQVAFTRLEATVDAAAPVGGAAEKPKTNDNW